MRHAPHFATRCRRKRFRPTTLLGAIDKYQSEAKTHRRYAATPGAAANALSELLRQTQSSRGRFHRLNHQTSIDGKVCFGLVVSARRCA
jgi:hypothetical protein